MTDEIPDDFDEDLEDDLEEILRRHLDLGDTDPEGLADAFLALVSQLPLGLYDGPKDIAVLDRLIQGLTLLNETVLSDFSLTANEELSMRLFETDRSGSEFELSHDNYCTPNLGSAFFDFLKLAPVVRNAVTKFRDEIEASEKKRKSLARIDLYRLAVVHNAVLCWKNFGRRPLPTADIKPAQPFARYLADVLELFEIESSPTKAYQSWREQIGDYTPFGKMSPAKAAKAP